MATEVQIALQPQAGPDPSAQLVAAAVRQVRASLALLAQQVGQSFVGTVVDAPDLPTGFAQISTAYAHTTLRLEHPIAAGSHVQISVQAPSSPGAPPSISVTPLPPPRSAAPATSPHVPVPAAFSGPPTTAPTRPAAVIAQPVAPTPPPPQVLPHAQNPVEHQQFTSQPPAPSVTAPGPPAAPAPVTPASPPPPPLEPAAPTEKSLGVQSLANAPARAVPTPLPSAPPAVLPPASASVQPVPPPTVAPVPGTPPLTVSPSPAISSTISIASPIPAASPGPSPAIPAAAAPPLAAAPSPLPAAGLPAQHQILQRLSQALALPTVSAAVPTATQAPLLHLQQSPAPLLEALARQVTQLPPAVAQAATRLLSHRLPLDRGTPTAAALKTAVLASGVFLDPPSRSAAAPDMRAALTQLRSALLDWVGEAVDPVTPVGQRPPPPARGAQPRAPQPLRMPSPPDEVLEPQTARQLLSQTEGALARVKLLQLTSQGNDQRLGANVSPAEWNLELPLLLGQELAMVQVQIGRDAREQRASREQSWRLRFALRLTAIGEVGAHVALTGRRASVALWAEEQETADSIAAMLPELASALSAKGLEVGALTMRVGAPQPPGATPGHLMDSLT